MLDITTRAVPFRDRTGFGVPFFPTLVPSTKQIKERTGKKQVLVRGQEFGLIFKRSTKIA